MSGSVTDPRVLNDPQLREILEICDDCGPAYRKKFLRLMRLLPRVDKETRREALAIEGIDEQIAFLAARVKTH